MENIIGRYYCFVESVEDLNDELIFTFDGIEKNWIDQRLSISFNFVNSINELTPQVIIGSVKKYPTNIGVEFDLKGATNSANKWYEVELIRNTTPFSAELYVDNTEIIEPIRCFIKSTTEIDLNSQLGNFLSSNISLDQIEDSSEAELAIAIKINTNTDKIFSTVYNVGHGNMNAICDELNIPLLYFDMGGGSKKTASTYPNKLQLCFTQFNTVIISHWDMDHIETIRRYQYKKDWVLFSGKIMIAPRQLLGPTHFKIAIVFSKIGKLLIWPNSLPWIKSKHCSIYKCTGTEKNDSGLALIVESPKNDIKKVLHPADAAYMYIPYSLEDIFDGLVITHHGANFETDNSPIPFVVNGSIAYSHANKYGHPTTDSIKAHEDSGWTNRRDTNKGNIAFTKAKQIIYTPCNGKHCTLNILQTFS